MTLTIVVRSVLLSCVFMQCAVAAATEPWAAEPTSFRGVQLGVPLVGQFPECPKDKRGAYEYAPKVTCYQSDGKPNPYAHGAVIAKVFNLADIGVEGPSAIPGLNSTHVTIADGKVARVRVVYNAGYHDSFRRLLEEKFCAPHQVATQTLRNGLGATFTGSDAIWTGNHATLVSMQYYNSLRYSLVQVSLNTFEALDNDEVARGDQKSNL